ncbi:MAG: tetratricopeptide repeat protein [Thermoanaerobaculia bacterium]
MTVRPLLSRRRICWLFALAAALPLSLLAEERILVLHAEDMKGNSVAGVVFAPKGDGAAGPPTDTWGKTRLLLAPNTRPGQMVTLQIRGREWFFVSPYHQRTPVPEFTNESDNFVEIVLARYKDKSLLSSYRAIEAITSRILEQLGPKLDRNTTFEEERNAILAEQAAELGLKPSKVDRAIRDWGAKAQIHYAVGLAALYRSDNAKAEEQLSVALETRRKELREARESAATASLSEYAPWVAESREPRKRALTEASSKVAEAAFFLGQALYEQGKFGKAADAYRESVEAGGEDYVTLTNFGISLIKAGDLRGAILPLQRSLQLKEMSFSAEDPALGRGLTNLAVLYAVQGRYKDAEPLFQRSLEILKKRLGPDHLDVARNLNNLAELYRAQGRYSEAEAPYMRSLDIREKTLGPVHLDVSTSLNSLAALYRTQGRFQEAEKLYKRSLSIREKLLGPKHPYVATSLNNLGELYVIQGRYAEAEPLYQRSLKIRENALGPEHSNVATTLNNLAELRDKQGQYSEAERLYKRSLEIREKALGPEHPDVATSLDNLARLYYTQQKLETAEDLSKRAVDIAEKSLGRCHPTTAAMIENRAAILGALGRAEEAQQLSEHAKKIRTGECRNPD